MDEKPIHRVKPYSLDLRIVAMNKIAAGVSVKDIAIFLGASQATIYRWKQRPQLAASPNLGPKFIPLPISLEDLLAQNPGKTLRQLAELLPIQKTALFRRLKNANITFKKKVIPTEKPIR